MIAGFEWPVAASDFHKKLFSNVEEYGWHLVGIYAEEDYPEFVFSVGLYYHYTHPEVLVMGLPSNTAAGLINAVGEMVRNGVVIEKGRPYTGVADDCPVAFVPIDKRHYHQHLGIAVWFYSSLPDDFPALQLVWPDKAGLFPWQLGYDEEYGSQQRLLHATS